jgi:hypothetical protein
MEIGTYSNHAVHTGVSVPSLHTGELVQYRRAATLTVHKLTSRQVLIFVVLGDSVTNFRELVVYACIQSLYTHTIRTLTVHPTDMDSSELVRGEGGQDQEHAEEEGEAAVAAERLRIGRRTRTLHVVAAVFMGVQAIAYGAVGASATVKPTVGFPQNCENGPICDPGMKILGETDPVWLIILFVSLAAFDHLVTAAYAYAFEASALRWLFVVRSNPFRSVSLPYSLGSILYWFCAI